MNPTVTFVEDARELAIWHQTPFVPNVGDEVVLWVHQDVRQPVGVYRVLSREAVQNGVYVGVVVTCRVTFIEWRERS